MVAAARQAVLQVRQWIAALTFVLWMDLAANATFVFVPRRKTLALAFVGVSLLCTLLAAILLMLLLMETRAFKAGYAALMCHKFARVFLVGAVYLVLTFALGGLVLVRRLGLPPCIVLRCAARLTRLRSQRDLSKLHFYWSAAYHAVFVLQKFGARGWPGLAPSN